MKLNFRVLNTSLRGLQYETDRETVRVGRAEGNDLVLQQQSVSRRHATITNHNGTVMVQDEGSRNETELDGETISSATPFRSGCILSFGDVAVQVTCPEREPGVSEVEEEVTPEGGVPAIGETEEKIGIEPVDGEVQRAIPDGWVRREATGVPARLSGQEIERKLWPVLALVLGVAVGALLVVYFLGTSGTLKMPERELGVALRLGQKKVVPVRRGFVKATDIKPEGAVSVSRALNLDIALELEAKAEGLATVRLENEAKEFALLHVNVLPRAHEKVEEFFAESIETRTERMAVARGQMKRAEVLREQKDPYEAMKCYERAIALMEPLAQRPPKELRQAEQWRTRLEEEIQRRYERLTFEMSNFMKSGDKKMALQRLADIKELIPDEGDLRWQNADLLYRLLERVIRRENERRGL
jgi:hypothetical protein